jgi:hypothetical protein
MTARQTAQVFDLDARRSLRQALAGAAVAYAFASTGAIAWEAPTSPGVSRVSIGPSSRMAGSKPTTWSISGSLAMRVCQLKASAKPSQRPSEALDHFTGIILDPVDEGGLAPPQHGQSQGVQAGAVDDATVVAELALRVYD